MGYIVALDIGIASVGVAVIDSVTGKVLEAISAIYPEASAADNAVRRAMRQGRRLTGRRKTRIEDFNKLWTSFGFTIPSENENDIVGLKVHGLTKELQLDKLYCILRNYLKHRGISYLEDAVDDDIKVDNCIFANGV